VELSFTLTLILSHQGRGIFYEIMRLTIICHFDFLCLIFDIVQDLVLGI